MRVKYHCSNSNDPLCRYNVKQAAYELPVYAGSSAWSEKPWVFSSLLRFAVPFLKKGGLSPAKHLLPTG